MPLFCHVISLDPTMKGTGDLVSVSPLTKVSRLPSLTLISYMEVEIKHLYFVTLRSCDLIIKEVCDLVSATSSP